ncbi:Hypothetical protein SCF082_LOCUS17018 [Durusdinium trenchii]
MVAAAMCNTSSLAKLTLIIHCRQEPTICRARLPLLLEFSVYFKKTVILLNKDPGWLPGALHCEMAGDPYFCVAEEIPRSHDSDGILYMQFDVAMSPCEMAQRLDVTAMGTFEDLEDKYITYARLDECNTVLADVCGWPWWNMANDNSKKNLLNTAKALAEIRSKREIDNASILQKLETGVWRGVSDFFYVPKQAFGPFATFAKPFKDNNVFNELGSPSVLMTSAEVSGVSLQNFGCHGNCCAAVGKQEILSEGFLCGHKVDYQRPCNRLAVQLLAAQGRPHPGPQALHTVNANVPPEFAPPCEMANLMNVTLIIHCTQLCHERQFLLQEYFHYFQHVILLTREDLPFLTARTCAAEVYWCVAEEIAKSANSKGIMFLHFDVAMSPCEITRRLDAAKVGTFEELTNITAAKLDECNRKKLNCQWQHWNADKSRAQILNAVASLEAPLNKTWAFRSLKNGSIFRVFSGLFYLPEKAFPLFQAAARILNDWDLPHEIAVPMLLALSEVELQNLGCSPKVSEPEFAKGFVCGRGFESDVSSMDTLEDMLCDPAKYFPPQQLVSEIRPGKVSWMMRTPQELQRSLNEQSTFVVVLLVLVSILLWFRMRILRQGWHRVNSGRP